MVYSFEYVLFVKVQVFTDTKGIFMKKKIKKKVKMIPYKINKTKSHLHQIEKKRPHDIINLFSFIFFF